MARIVVVDDDEDMRMLVEFKLCRVGHEVVTAANGQEGLDACRRVNPDLAIIDVNMPVMSGLDMLQQLRGSTEHRELPVIMLTGMARDDDTVLGLRAGATDYVTKPFSPQALASRVDAVLQPHRDLTA